jgi:serine/threonine protein kinase/Tol biopolymer transport system component
MATDRWQALERLYHAALERPVGERSAFLRQACEDETLRREVLALLDQPSMPNFLGEPAVNVAAAMVDDVHSHWIGRRIGIYQLQTLLGKGGMGEVYRARDTRLGRDVAVKVLPLAFTADPERLARFEREARVLAALNHPHIGTIHGLEESEGVRALVLELVEGETLADRVHHGALGIPDALAIARQIADALEAAHDKGIIHRDLKPSNIKITPAGVVKVLDFGLAKGGAESSVSDLTQSPTITIGATHGGVILGTAAYMAPEQARGLAVDKRTDIWAFGCVLFEMLTGRTAFQGGTVSDTIAAILQREPDWASLPPATPRTIDRLLRRCFEKDSRRRLRDIGEARIELDEALSRPTAQEIPVTKVDNRTAPWRALTFAALAGALVSALAIAIWPRSAPQSAWTNPLENARFTRLTDFPGTEASADISPDGRFVVFRSDRAGDGEWDLWLTQVGTGTFRNLTENVPSLGPGNPTVRFVGFSGDGSQVWFAAQGQRPMAMPLLGGTPRPYLGERAATPAWSKDGARMAYFTGADGDPIFLANATGGEARQIHGDQAGIHNHNLVWSTDGQWIYFVHGHAETDEMDVWRIRPSGGTAERMTQRNAAATFLAPIDSRVLLYVARDEDRSGPWLWALDVESRVSHRITAGLEQYHSVAASYDGRRVVATVASPTASLWSVPILDRVAADSDVKPYPVPSVRALSPRFDKTSLYYLSARGTGDGLWRFRDDEASEIWKGSDGALDQPPAVSPDGRSVAVVLRKDGRRQLTVMSTDGADAHALTPSINIQGAPDWSPDGHWIVTGGSNENGPGLFKLSVDGGVPIRLVSSFASDPDWSPDGSLIVYAGPVVSGQIQVLAVRPDGSAVALPQIYGQAGRQNFRILPDGKGLVYVPRDKQGDFWILDFSTKNSRPVAHLTDVTRIQSFDITLDGKQIVFDRVRENSDIVLIDIPAR